MILNLRKEQGKKEKKKREALVYAVCNANKQSFVLPDSASGGKLTKKESDQWNGSRNVVDFKEPNDSNED